MGILVRGLAMNNGVPPSGSGSRPTDEASISVESSPKASIPNAACDECGGDGSIECVKMFADETEQVSWETCEVCLGTGRI